MGTNSSNKKMLANETIYKILQWLPIVISAVFFIINVLKKNVPAMIAIGVCLLAFTLIIVITRMKNVPLYQREYAISIAIPTLVFIISLFSGESYSDDFPMMLAVLGLSGMFLEPKITRAQVCLTYVYFVLMYLIHPEKAGALSQYILCFACYILSSVLYIQVIKRGRAFIEMSVQKAGESEQLLDSIRKMGAELQSDFETSSEKIEVRTKGLREESQSITRGAGLVSESCDGAQEKIVETKTQLSQLDDGVKQFETTLIDNKNNVEQMSEKMEAVGAVISQSGEVFRTLEEQMQEIAGVAKQINNIAFRLTILSLNASVESAHAGEYGAGFEVVASEMRALSESSAGFSDKVADLVKDLLEKVDTASGQIEESQESFLLTKDVMNGLVASFNRLNEQFAELHENIEKQNVNVNQIDYIFTDLGNKVTDMHNSSLANQEAVNGIADAMVEFSGNVESIVKNTQSV